MGSSVSNSLFLTIVKEKTVNSTMEIIVDILVHVQGVDYVCIIVIHRLLYLYEVL